MAKLSHFPLFYKEILQVISLLSYKPKLFLIRNVESKWTEIQVGRPTCVPKHLLKSW